MDEKLKALNLANFILGFTGYSICLVCSVSMLITILRKKLKIQMITSLLIIQVSIALLAISMYSLLYSKIKTEKNKVQASIGFFVTLTIFMISVSLKHWIYTMKLWRLANTLKQMIDGNEHKNIIIKYEVQIYRAVIILSFSVPLILFVVWIVFM